MGRWFAFADSIELLDGEGVGRRQRMHGHWGRKQSEIDQEVVSFRPPQTLAWRHLAERLNGKPAPRFDLPTSILRFAARLRPDLAEVVRSADGVTFWATDAKARAELGYAPRSLREGLVSYLSSSSSSSSSSNSSE